MNYYFDSSALIKRFIEEKGSDRVEKLFQKADNIFTSTVTEIECLSVLKRLFVDDLITPKDLKTIKNELELDFNSYKIIPLDLGLKASCRKIIEKYQIRSLDSIQLASAIRAKNQIDHFVASDKNLLKVAKMEGFAILDPNQNIS